MNLHLPRLRFRAAPLLLGLLLVDLHAGLRVPLLSNPLLPRASATALPADRILVKPRPGADLTHVNLLLDALLVRTIPEVGNLHVLRVPAGSTAEALIASYQQSGLIEYAEPDRVVQLFQAPNDTRYFDNTLWALHNTGQSGGTPGADIKAPEAWDVQHSAENIVVAVIDTGLRLTHEDLAANLWTNSGEIPGNGIDDDGDGFVDDVHGINAITGTGDPSDDFGHGSHVAGIIGAIGGNGLGVVGVAWRVQLMPLKFIDAQGRGAISDAVACIAYARRHGARIINASWGDPAFESAALRDAIASARDAGILFVAAAGNSASNNDATPLYPASYDLDNILSVAATDRNDHLSFFSNYGATRVHLGAPGEEIYSCWSGGDSDYRYVSGTSMAAGYVSGAAAVLLAHAPAENYAAIRQRIVSSTDPVAALDGRCVSAGRLNLFAALGGHPPGRPAVNVIASVATASEQDTQPGEFTFTRTGDTSAPLVVGYSVGGTATNGADYQTLPASVTIPAGATAATLRVTPIDDTLVEGSETVVVILNSSAPYDVGTPDRATLSLADNDAPPPTTPPPTTPPPTIPPPPTTPPPTPPPAAVTANFSPFPTSGTAPLGVQFDDHSSGPVAARAWDFGDGSKSDTANPYHTFRDAGTFTVKLTVTGDSGQTNTTTTTITVNAPTPPPPTPTPTPTPPPPTTPPPTPPPPTTPTPTPTPPTTDRPTVTVVASQSTASESGAVGIFTVHLSAPTTHDLSIKFTMGGNAQYGVDYQGVGDSVTIPAGAMSADVKIVPIDDSDVEVDEPCYLMLFGYTGAPYVVGHPDSATVTIADNDRTAVRPVATVVASDPNAAEDGDPGTFTIHFSEPAPVPITVKFTLGGNAQNGVDYERVGDSVTMPAGATSVDVKISPIADNDREIDEPCYLMLFGYTGAPYTVGKPDSAAVIIANR